MPKPRALDPADIAEHQEFVEAFPELAATDAPTLGKIVAGMVETITTGEPSDLLQDTATAHNDTAAARDEVAEAIANAVEARDRGDHDTADRAIEFIRSFDTGRLDPADVKPMTDALNAIPDRPAEEPKPKTRARKAKTEAIPSKPDVMSAFDRGARLSLPEPSPAEVDPALVGKTRRRAPRGASSGRPTGSDELTSLFAAGLITLIAFTMGDDFQPTEQEATDLARPLGNIMARRIDLAAKLGQDANDVIAFTIAVMAYGVRVGPIAAQKTRDWNDDRVTRSKRTRVSDVGLSTGAGGMAVGNDGGQSPTDGTAYNPFDALAKARRNGLTGITSHPDDATGRATPVVS